MHRIFRKAGAKVLIFPQTAKKNLKNLNHIEKTVCSPRANSVFSLRKRCILIEKTVYSHWENDVFSIEKTMFPFRGTDVTHWKNVLFTIFFDTNVWQLRFFPYFCPVFLRTQSSARTIATRARHIFCSNLWHELPPRPREFCEHYLIQIGVCAYGDAIGARGSLWDDDEE
jgi:hypothetical protein